MSLDAFVDRMRIREEDLWRSEGIVTRPTGTSTFNEATGEETPDAAAPVYEGICQVRAAKWVGVDTQAGEREVRLKALRAKFPANTPIEEGDVLVLTISELDADLVGREFRVKDVLHDDWQIARVAMVEEVGGS